MKRNIVSTFLVAVIAVFGFINLSGAQTMSDSQQHLDARQENIALIAALTAKGDLPKLKDALAKGLDAGLTVNEIKEVLVQMYAYVGFPRSLNGINTFMAVLDERKARGITDVQGAQASPINDRQDKYARGKAVLETLTNRPDVGQASGFGAFSPEIDVFLKEHLFADIFGRDVLSYSDRELATVAALISLSGVEPMMQSHMNMAMNTGLTEAQIRQVLAIVETNIGKQEAQTGAQMLEKVLADRK